MPLNKTYPWKRTYIFAVFHGTRNVDCFNSLLWFCFVWTAVEKTLRLRLISTCTVLSIASFRFSNKDRSQLLHLEENTVVLASVNEQKMTGRLTDAEKYLTFPLLRSLTFSFTCSLVARNTTSVISSLISLRITK